MLTSERNIHHFWEKTFQNPRMMSCVVCFLLFLEYKKETQMQETMQGKKNSHKKISNFNANCSKNLVQKLFETFRNEMTFLSNVLRWVPFSGSYHSFFEHIQIFCLCFTSSLHQKPLSSMVKKEGRWRDTGRHTTCITNRHSSESDATMRFFCFSYIREFKSSEKRKKCENVTL